MTSQEEPQTVTKELVDRIADSTKQTKVVVKDIIQRFLDEIIIELSAGNRLEFREFGVFDQGGHALPAERRIRARWRRFRFRPSAWSSSRSGA